MAGFTNAFVVSCASAPPPTATAASGNAASVSARDIVQEASDSTGASEQERTQRATEQARVALTQQIRIRVQSQVDSERVRTMRNANGERAVQSDSTFRQSSRQTSDLVLEGARTVDVRCDASSCRVRVALDRDDALRRIDARMRVEAERVSSLLADARALLQRGDAFAAIRNVGRADALRRGRLLELWETALAFDPEANAPGPSDSELTAVRREALDHAHLVAAFSPPDQEPWTGFWGRVSRRLASAGWPSIGTDSAADSTAWRIEGTVDAAPSSTMGSLRFARARAALVLRRPGQEAATLTIEARGGGASDDIAVRNAVEDLAERISNAIGELLSGDEHQRTAMR